MKNLSWQNHPFYHYTGYYFAENGKFMRKDEICEVDRNHPQGISGKCLQEILTDVVQS